MLGGARSGKSAFAQRLALECGQPVLYVATATQCDPDDAEMAERIARHRADRPPEWRTLEVCLDLAAAVARERNDARTILIEDLTLALSNLLLTSEAALAEQRLADDIDLLLQTEAHVVMVSNEVGMGLVPMSALGRGFRDTLGRINQHAAALCAEVYVLIAGLPLRLK